MQDIVYRLLWVGLPSRKYLAAQWGRGWRGWRSGGSRLLQKLKATSSSVLLGISALSVDANSNVCRDQAREKKTHLWSLHQRVVEETRAEG